MTGALPGSAYLTWYPPLRSTLLVLSKVYRAVDMGVFEDLAQLAVAACADSMKVCMQLGVFPRLLIRYIILSPIEPGFNFILILAYSKYIMILHT